MTFSLPWSCCLSSRTSASDPWSCDSMLCARAFTCQARGKSCRQRQRKIGIRGCRERHFQHTPRICRVQLGKTTSHFKNPLSELFAFLSCRNDGGSLLLHLRCASNSNLQARLAARRLHHTLKAKRITSACYSMSGWSTQVTGDTHLLRN